MYNNLAVVFPSVLIVGIGILGFFTNRIVGHYTKYVAERDDVTHDKVRKSFVHFYVTLICCLIVAFVDIALQLLGKI